MIVAALAALLVGMGGDGLSIDDFKDRIKDTISDKARVEQINGILDEMEELAKDYDEELKSVGKRVSDYNKDYDAPEYGLQAIFADGIESSNAARAKFLDRHFKMKDLMTEDEWNKIFAPPKSEKSD